MPKIIARIKIFIYRLSFNSTILSVIRFLSKPLAVPVFYQHDVAQQKLPHKKPLYVIVSVDTESGFVTSNEERLWQVNNPDLFQGFYYGIPNWMNLLEKHGVKGNFMLSTQCFSAKGKEKTFIEKGLNRLLETNHEIGYHLHPKSDRSLERILGKKLEYTSSKFYTVTEIDEMLKAARYLLQDGLGKQINKKVLSFRWGNYGLYQHAFQVLEKNGFTIDSSACPGKSGHKSDDKIFDWSQYRSHLPKLLQETRVLEIPVTTFDFLNHTLIANPLYHPWLDIVFDKYLLLNERLNAPFFFVLLSHSSEATYKNGDSTKIISVMDAFLHRVRRMENVSIVTFQEAYKIFYKNE